MARTGSNPEVIDRLAALGDVIRLRALRLLEREELSVGELASVLQLPQSTVSRHLKILLDGGWLAKRTVGPAGFYRLLLDDLPDADRQLWLVVRAQMGPGPALDEDLRRLESVLAERKTDSAAFFGRIAGAWDEIRSELFGDRFTLHAMMGLLDPSWTIADLGCGTGNVAELACPWVEGVVAVDASETMLEAARRRLDEPPNLEFRAGPLERLPLADASVDAAVCVLVLHHLEDPAAAIREMARVLRTERGGGVALVVDMFEHARDEYARTMGHRHLGFGAGTIERMFTDAGFERVTQRALAGQASARGPGLFAATGRLG